MHQAEKYEMIPIKLQNLVTCKWDTITKEHENVNFFLQILNNNAIKNEFENDAISKNEFENDAISKNEFEKVQFQKW